MLAKVMLGEPVLIGRDADGTPFALRDICPHRGMPLSGRRISTGARSSAAITAGASTPAGVAPRSRRWCRARPSTPSRVQVRSYPVREVQGNIWVFFGDDPAAAPEIPDARRVRGRRPRGSSKPSRFAAAIDHAVVGLMDPAHGPFVHRAWWWRSRRSIHAKAKAFAPSPWGFTMIRHPPSANSRAYRLLGGAPETEIVFRLPSVRIEQIRAGRHPVGNLTAITPIDDRNDRDQPLHLLDRAVAQRAEAAAAALCARLSAPGPRRSWSASSRGCGWSRR